MNEERTQNGLSNRDIDKHLWPIHLKPESGELLSSWLVRLAQKHQLTAQSFGNLIWPNIQIWTRDVDVLAPFQILATLSHKTGTSLERCFKTCIPSLAGTYFESCQPRSTTAYISPLGIIHRSRKCYGLQFCPYCLKQKPLYLIDWRIACNTICPIHNIQLLDACPSCQRPIAFHRHNNHVSNIGSCSYCNEPLWKNAPIVNISRNVERDMLTDWYLARKRGYISLSPTVSLRPLPFFIALRQIAKLSLSSKADTYWYTLKEMSFKGDTHIDNASNVIEKCRNKERHSIFYSCAWLLQDWPFRFSEWAHNAGFSYSDFHKDIRQLPYWFESQIISCGLYYKKYSPNQAEVISAIDYCRLSKIKKNSLIKLLGTSSKNRALKKVAPTKKILRRAPQIDTSLMPELTHVILSTTKLNGIRNHTLRQVWIALLISSCCQLQSDKVISFYKQNLRYCTMTNLWFVKIKGKHIYLVHPSIDESSINSIITRIKNQPGDYLITSQLGNRLRSDRFRHSFLRVANKLR